MKVLAVAALLVLPLLFISSPSAAATTQVLTIDTAHAQPLVPFRNFDGNPPKLFDINGDGKMEILAQNDNNYAYIFDSKNGTILAQLKTTFPAGWGARTFNGPEVAVFDSGGTVRVILQNSAAYVASFRYDPNASTNGHFAFVKEWERRLADCYNNPGSDSKPVLADLDKDGKYEIVASTEETGLYALRMDGQLYWKKCIGGGNAEPTVGDINGDGWLDVAFGSDGGIVTAMNGRTGATMWSYNALANFNLGSGSMPVGVTLGQLDGVSGADVVVGARDSHDPVNWTSDHALLLALRSNGTLLWGRQDPTGNPLTYTHVVIVDADRDGQNEVYWGDWNTIGHKPPFNESQSWKVTGPGHFYRYDRFGNMTWRQSLNTYWSNKDLTLADVNGDGIQDMLANGPGTGTQGDGIWYLDSRTGAKETFIATPHWRVSREPVIGDLYGTGMMQWVVEVGAGDSTVTGGAILVYDTGVAYNSVYPHLPYPTLTAPPPPPPPPTGPSFNSTFKIKSPNTYWEEVSVTPSPTRTISQVDMRISGSAWEPMTHASWGAWTLSRKAATGSIVEFLAHDPSGGLSQSAPFKWLDGNLTKGSVAPGAAPPPPPPPPSNAFTVTFEPTASSNAYWIEAKVRTTEPLAGVDTRVNAGIWKPLNHTNWDTWAKSIHAVAGSQVQFRATTTYGAMAISGNFSWLGGTPNYNVTFTPKSQTNVYWVEVKVTSAIAVLKVEASTNGGAWVNLPATNWGTWAKSYAVPKGASVQFKATNDAGNPVLSSSYIWG